MEEAVCTVADSFVTVNTSRADNADRRLANLHNTALYRRCMCTQQDVGMTFDEESILHIACRMIFGEVH